MIVTLMCGRIVFAGSLAAHRRIRKRSVNVPALPNDTQRSGFLDTQVCLKVYFLFSVHGYGLKKNARETDPSEMCFCTGDRAVGRTQTEKTRPHELY